MDFMLDDNATRKIIVLLLKKSGGMSIEDLSKNISITPMGIRQHLLSLEKKGIVTYYAKKHGIGRPGFVYRLTDLAEDLFPKKYDSFALDVLRDIEKNEGKEKVDQIFAWRREGLFKVRNEQLAAKGSRDELVRGLKDVLESEGYLVELERENGSYHLMQYNCPINKIAFEYDTACVHELQLYRDLIGPDVIRQESLSQGSTSCHYIIPAA